MHRMHSLLNMKYKKHNSYSMFTARGLPNTMNAHRFDGAQMDRVADIFEGEMQCRNACMQQKGMGLAPGLPEPEGAACAGQEGCKAHDRATAASMVGFDHLRTQGAVRGLCSGFHAR